MSRSNLQLVSSDGIPHKKSGSGGGGMDNFSERVGRLESDVEYIKRDVAEIKVDLKEFKKDVNEFKKDVGTFREETMKEFGKVRSEMHNLARQTIMWNIGTVFTAVGLMFGLMRYLA